MTSDTSKEQQLLPKKTPRKSVVESESEEEQNFDLAKKTVEMIEDAKQFHKFSQNVLDTTQNDQTFEDAVKSTKRKRK